MAFVVEDGTGIASATSYISEDVLEAYADDRGVALTSSDNVEAALIRATSYIDGYRARFPGQRAFGRAQGLEWPRIGAYYPSQGSGINGDYYTQLGYYQFGYDGYIAQYQDYIPPNVIPIEVIKATCEAAIRELTRPSSLIPDNVVDSIGGGAIKKISAGGTSKEYAVGVQATRSTQPFPIIDDILSVLLTTTGMFGVAVRG